MKVPENTRCKNCETLLSGPNCHHCGQHYISERWSVPGLIKQFLSQISNIEKGFLHTTWAMLRSPGTLIRDYWSGKTMPYYNPFRFMLIWTAINLLINFWLGIDDMIQQSMDSGVWEEGVQPDRMEAASQRFDSWINVLVLLVVPVRSAMSYLFFRSKGWNYAEHLIMNSFIFGTGAFLSSFTQVGFYLMPSLFSAYFIFYYILGLVYDSYVFNRTFKERWWLVIMKALVIGIIGLVTLILLVYVFSALLLALP